MKLKTVEVNGTTYAVIADGKPVFVHDDGKEIGFDAPAAVQAISARNGEAQKHREAKEAAEAKLKLFDGLDPEAARKAIDTVKNLEDGKLIEAGKVEEMKAGIVKAEGEKHAGALKSLNDKVTDLTDQLGKSAQAFFTEKVGGAFARSKFISEKTTLPPDIAQATFGSRFKIENGNIVGLGVDGQPIYSRSKSGQLADFEEAIESMVDGYANRDSILKGTGGGGGSKGGNGGGAGGKTITRKEFDALGPTERVAKMGEGIKVVDG